MLNTQKLRRPAGLAAIALTTGLAGCSKAVVLNPAGDIAAQQGQMVITATLLMLIIIVPVIALTLFFAWKYRQSNTEAEYDPEWHHSTTLELVIWTVPLMIIIALGALGRDLAGEKKVLEDHGVHLFPTSRYRRRG